MFSRTDSFKFAIRIFPHSSMNVRRSDKGRESIFPGKRRNFCPVSDSENVFFSLDLNHDTDWKIENVKVSLPVVKSKKKRGSVLLFSHFLSRDLRRFPKKSVLSFKSLPFPTYFPRDLLILLKHSKLISSPCIRVSRSRLPVTEQKMALAIRKVIHPLFSRFLKSNQSGTAHVRDFKHP